MCQGKYPAAGVEVLPLDLSSGEVVLKKSVQEAESLFSDAGVDFMIHNAAFERPVITTFHLFLLPVYCTSSFPVVLLRLSAY